MSCEKLDHSGLPTPQSEYPPIDSLDWDRSEDSFCPVRNLVPVEPGTPSILPSSACPASLHLFLKFRQKSSFSPSNNVSALSIDFPCLDGPRDTYRTVKSFLRLAPPQPGNLALFEPNMGLPTYRKSMPSSPLIDVSVNFPPQP